MSRIKLVIFCLLSVLLSSCAFFNNKADIVPEDFIVKQDTAFVLNELEEIEATGEHVVRFKRGKAEISDKEQQKLFQWIEDDIPTMIAVRGTGGAEKYKELGNQRSLAVINLLQSTQANIEIILLDYKSDLPGGRAIIQSVPANLALAVRQQAPILIIKSS